jgi:hypothetical protein
LEWLNQAFPCHRRHTVTEVITEVLDRARQYSARCPACDTGYWVVARVYRVDGAPLRLMEWTLRAGGLTVVLPPDVPDLWHSTDAPLYADVPWSSRWPQDPRRPSDGPWSLRRVSLDNVRRDGYRATVHRLAGEADWDATKPNTHPIVVIEPVTVRGATVVHAGEVLLARRGWVRAAAGSVVLTSARAVNHDLVVSRGCAFITPPVDFDLDPPDGSRRLFDPVNR